MPPVHPTLAVLEQLTERAPVVCFAKDREGRYLFVNRAWTALFGTTAEKVVGRGDLELFDQVTARGFLRNDTQVMTERRAIEVHEPVPVGGQSRVYLSSKFPLVAADGSVFGVGGMALDVTEREHARAALEVSERRYRSVVENSPAAYVIFDPEQGRFVHANEVAARLFETTIEHLLTLSPVAVSPARQADGRASQEAARQYIAAALRGEHVAFDWAHQTVAGKPLACRVWLDGLEENGRLLARAFILDLSEIVHARQELERQRALLLRTQDLARVGGWDYDVVSGALQLSGGVIERLHRDFAGPSVTDTIARMPPPTREALVAVMTGMRAGKGFDLEIELPPAEGGRSRALRVVGEVELEQGEARRARGWVQDVSQTRELEARLRQSSKMDALGQLAGGVAHDFNNMLGAIFAATALLETKLQGADADVVDSLRVIDQAARQAAALTRNLLVFSRKEPARRALVTIDEVVRGAMAILERTLDRRITITHRPAEPSPFAQVDPAQLQNVLINLGINARDAMPDGGALRFETHEQELDAAAAGALLPVLAAGRFVCLRVSDTGAGIAPEHLPHVFEPFFTTKGVGQGTGLGLATAYATLRECGGVLTVESTPGRGSTFSLWIPQASAPTRPLTPPPGPSIERGAVLLVDDEALVRRSTRRLLSSFGFTVLEAGDGLEAEAVLAKAEQVDFVLLDLMMPGRGPDETVAALRRLRPELPIVLCSGYAPEEVATRLLREPRVRQLQKPWGRAQLFAALDGLL